MKKIFLVLIVVFLFFLKFSGYRIEATSNDAITPIFSSDVWEFRQTGNYKKEGKYGGIISNYSTYQLNNDYNEDENYNYYLFDQRVTMSLSQDCDTPIKKWYGRISIFYSKSS